MIIKSGFMGDEGMKPVNYVVHGRGALRFGIQARVLTLAVLFTLLTAGAIVVTSTLSLSAQLRRSVIQSAEYALQTSAAAICQDIQEVDDLSRWSRIDANVRTAMLTNIPSSTMVNSIYPIISNKYNSMHTAPYIQRYLIHSTNGRTIMLGTAVNQSVLLDRDNIAKFPGFGEGEFPTQWEQIIRDPLIQPGIAVNGIPISSKTNSNDGRYTASVYLSVSPALITDTLKDFSLEEGAWLCWIMGSQFYRVENGTFTLVGPVEKLPDSEDPAQDTLDSGTLLYSTELDGNACNVILCPLGLHGLYLGEVIPNSQFSHPLSLIQGPALFSLIFVLLMGIVIAVLLHWTVAVPIRALQRQMETVSQGDFSPNPAIEWNHELGDVGRGINRLSRNVSSLMEKRIEDEQQRLALEYRMLQNQISPHFIYNTLNSIKWMATIQHAPGVAEMVTALSRLMKSVSKSSRKLVFLEEEFALLEDYFTIQRYRYGGTITLELPSLSGSDRDYLIPRFTLQPLAENAIFHGIEPNGGVGKLSIVLEQDSQNRDMLIHMIDDGVGMDPQQIDQLLTGPGGEAEDLEFRHLGLQSVHRLFQLSFGPDYGLTIQSSPGHGTTITMRLPRCSIDG